MAALESISIHVGMLRKPIKFSARFIVFFALSMVGVISAPQAYAQAPAAPASPAGLIQMFADAEAAFAAKDYPTAVAKIQGLLVGLGTNKEAPLEMLYFNIGLGNLLGEKAPEAEAGFLDYLKRYPRGEYASRSYLGI